MKKPKRAYGLSPTASDEGLGPNFGGDVSASAFVTFTILRAEFPIKKYGEPVLSDLGTPP